MRRPTAHLFFALLMASALLAPWTAPTVEARPAYANANAGSTQMTARQAAQQAKAQYGGKVLRVRKDGNAFKVRLLLDSGRVITVTIRG